MKSVIFARVEEEEKAKKVELETGESSIIRWPAWEISESGEELGEASQATRADPTKTL